MTAQVREILHHNGEQHSMSSLPLSRYMQQQGQPIRFDLSHTACHRCYVGTWAVREDRLYLVEIEARIGRRDVTLKDIFPRHPDAVFAHWYSGTARCPQGKRLQYVHQGFRSVYQDDLFLTFRQGVLVGEHRVQNGPIETTPQASKNTAWWRKK